MCVCSSSLIPAHKARAWWVVGVLLAGVAVLKPKVKHRTVCLKEGQDDLHRRLCPDRNWALDLEMPKFQKKKNGRQQPVTSNPSRLLLAASPSVLLVKVSSQ